MCNMARLGVSMLGAIRRGPERKTSWLFGTEHGVQVWTVSEDRRIAASILVGPQSIVLLNQYVIGTRREGEALAWALRLVNVGVSGFYFLRN